MIGGHERLIRMLQTTRRNYPIAMRRGGWANRGKNFSEKGVLLECGKRDLTTTKNVLHFLKTGNAKYMFALNKELFFVPVMMLLKCLKDVPDSYIYRRLMVGVGDNTYYKGVVASMLKELQEEGIFNQEQAQEYIGRTFRPKCLNSPPWYTDREVCQWLLKRTVAIHLDSDDDKFDIICVMIKKLFSYVQDECVVEGADSLMMHEIIMGGHLYLQVLKEKLYDFLIAWKINILAKRKTKASFELTPGTMSSCANSGGGNLEKQLENFLGTGNLPSRTGLGLMQDKGLTIMAENINRMRYMSHFRAIHRGAFFTEMRTTEVRALLPDAWGYVCPAHTPDGSPCGLLNHLAYPVELVTHLSDVSRIPEVLTSLGLITVNSFESLSQDLTNAFDVLLDGKLMGWVEKDKMKDMADMLRVLKVDASDARVPEMTEIVMVPARDIPGQYPGLFIFTGAARMMRPVINLAHNCIEYVGTFESVYMDICIREKEAYPGITTHMEIRPTSFLSNLACMIPLPDFNQSPRNMYQCQMAKQTLASPIHTWHSNSETKIYRLQTPTTPFFRPAHYDYVGMDDYPMGTNAIVAVISYSGYDMEDAMIINKMSLERGLCAGMIYKAEFVDLREKAGKRKGDKSDDCGLVFCRDPTKPELSRTLDLDGLPWPGVTLQEDDPMYCYFNREEGKFKVVSYKYKEAVIVDHVKLCSNDTGTSSKNRACISMRVPRNPTVGDKFASRSGQKGICSQRWPCEDLPWTSNGMFPDILFNPHGFPSRMTIAQMVESMAGKAGAIHGLCQDATPFTFSEDPGNDAIDYFAQQLEKAGYNYYGTETLYSGVSGVEIKAEIFFGVIHYQRLRHMVSDKYQVRSTGPIDQVTRQPVKGRKRHGGVRFGEMERDSLLSHGATFLLQDRLFHGSDKSRCSMCVGCGSFLSPSVQVSDNSIASGNRAVCVVCKSADSVSEFEVPFIFLHLVQELASINIKVKLQNNTI